MISDQIIRKIDILYKGRGFSLIFKATQIVSIVAGVYAFILIISINISQTIFMRLLIPIILFCGIVLLVGSALCEELISRHLKMIKQKILLISSTDIVWENIQEILTTTQHIATLTEKVSKLSILFRLFYTKKKQYKLYEIVTLLYSWLPTVLKELQEYLNIHIQEQQSSLRDAKYELSKNLSWVTDLVQVATLQESRLNRQIEQFEELQRTLVKL